LSCPATPPQAHLYRPIELRFAVLPVLLRCDGVHWGMDNLAMRAKAREYLTKAKRCEERAKKVRDQETRDWQLTLARTYRMLAEAESDLASRRLSVAA
jgi:hypothetical protein